MKNEARVKQANRNQICLDVIDYEHLIPEDHVARILVRFVERLNLHSFYEDIKSREGSCGRSAIDPQLLLCLWLYATLEGIGSARLLEKLCERDNTFRWICGGLRVNYHTLSDFRSGHAEKLDELLTDIITSCLSQGIIKLKSVIVDGTKIKANASKKSFKNRRHLTKLRKRTKEYITGLRQELEHDPEASQRRLEARRKRAQEEMEAKINDALEELPHIEAVKEAREDKVKKGTLVSEAKVSLSDKEARLMKFSDNSVKAGYNCQIAIDPDSFLILTSDVSQQGNDRGLLKPIVEDIEARYGSRHERALVDSGYQVHQDIVDLAEHKLSRNYYCR